MRKWRLDELPQLWNIIRGEMSLVGPRPERKVYIDQIVRQFPYYKYLLKAKPGLSSWGMVNVVRMVLGFGCRTVYFKVQAIDITSLIF